MDNPEKAVQTRQVSLPETDNLQFAEEESAADKINAEFYGDIQYPWPPWTIERFAQRDLWKRMLSQDLGYFERSILPKEARIWVAGCGTNQALFTALKFPDAFVLGSDLSKESLQVCSGNALQLGVGNLALRNESINRIDYREKFDYVMCTGVIHHNARPEASLRKLARAVKASGVMEIAVYNRFNRIFTSTFQLAVRILAGSTGRPNLEQEVPIANKLIRSLRDCDPLLRKLLDSQKDVPRAQMMDALLQPIEHSYTVESFEAMAADCGLELLVFSVDQFSQVSGKVEWNLEFEDEMLQQRYNSLPDTRRWQVTNLLRARHSPILWFYLQRKDSPNLRRTEHQICQRFLDTTFRRVSTEKIVYVRDEDGRYQKRPKPVPFPGIPSGPASQRVYEGLDENAPLRATLQRLGIRSSFPYLNRLRIALATSAYPFLEAGRG